MPVIIEYIRYRVEDGPAFEAAYTRAAASLDAAPQCLSYSLGRSTDEPSCYILRIEWTSVDGHLTGFRGGPHFAAFLSEIRSYVPDIEEMRHYETVLSGGQPSLYSWAGGAAAFSALTEAFYKLVGADDLLAPVFAGMDPHHASHVALWLGEVFGGPAAYTASRGGYDAMLAKHIGKAITEPQRRRWVNLILDAADQVGLPADPEFRAAFVSYLEWGTRLAVQNSAPGATPFRGAPVPHWGWGVAPPYIP
ncbi:group II truncated hemoglobin [Lentzea tibetensis]|uniref:group II truncated hemoglobin n=1 Tax=Lentzea tibetensis TaxID=2591470 RepID=UPI001C992C80|nr:antibiotic biosynthesis monooxygenase [Lentzea tibetensis]